MLGHQEIKKKPRNPRGDLWLQLDICEKLLESFNDLMNAEAAAAAAPEAQEGGAPASSETSPQTPQPIQLQQSTDLQQSHIAQLAPSGTAPVATSANETSGGADPSKDEDGLRESSGGDEESKDTNETEAKQDLLLTADGLYDCRDVACHFTKAHPPLEVLKAQCTSLRSGRIISCQQYIFKKMCSFNERCRYYHPDVQYDTLFQLVKNAGKKNLEMEESKKRDMSGLIAYTHQVNQYAAAVQGAAALGAYTHQPTTTPLQFYPAAATYSNPGQAAAQAITAATAGHHNTWSLVPTAAVAPAAHGWPASGLNSGGYYDLASMYQHQIPTLSSGPTMRGAADNSTVAAQAAAQLAAAAAAAASCNSSPTVEQGPTIIGHNMPESKKRRIEVIGPSYPSSSSSLGQQTEQPAVKKIAAAGGMVSPGRSTNIVLTANLLPSAAAANTTNTLPTFSAEHVTAAANNIINQPQLFNYLLNFTGSQQ